MDTENLIQQLEKEGFQEVRVCPLPPDSKLDEHTHDEHTVHIILQGELTVTDASGSRTFKPGDRVEFPAGTTHVARGSGTGEMIVGVKQ